MPLVGPGLLTYVSELTVGGRPVPEAIYKAFGNDSRALGHTGIVYAHRQTVSAELKCTWLSMHQAPGRPWGLEFTGCPISHGLVGGLTCNSTGFHITVRDIERDGALKHIRFSCRICKTAATVERPPELQSVTWLPRLVSCEYPDGPRAARHRVLSEWAKAATRPTDEGEGTSIQGQKRPPTSPQRAAAPQKKARTGR